MDTSTSVLRSLPVKFIGAFIALIIAGIGLYLVGVISMYAIAWVVWLIQAIFG